MKETTIPININVTQTLTREDTVIVPATYGGNDYHGYPEITPTDADIDDAYDQQGNDITYLLDTLARIARREIDKCPADQQDRRRYWQRILSDANAWTLTETVTEEA